MRYIYFAWVSTVEIHVTRSKWSQRTDTWESCSHCLPIYLSCALSAASILYCCTSRVSWGTSIRVRRDLWNAAHWVIKGAVNLYTWKSIDNIDGKAVLSSCRGIFIRGRCYSVNISAAWVRDVLLAKWFCLLRCLCARYWLIGNLRVIWLNQTSYCKQQSN